MCGIFGAYTNKEINLKGCLDNIKHRGPDSEGSFIYSPFETNESSDRVKNRLFLGFRRLAIIDLVEEANQPFIYEDYVLTFNGEIYNYLELRSELIEEGWAFSTESDTEVVLKSFIHWGTDCFNKFNGMWAICILDKNKDSVILSRDRFGIKPLFYSITDGLLAWASEIKQLHSAGVPKAFNENVLRDYIDNGILDADEETFFKNVNHFKPGCFAIFSLGHAIPKIINQYSYWQLAEKEVFQNLSYDEAKATFAQLFESSVKLRFRSDVPVGSCLSGGLDSSSIVSQAAHSLKQPIFTFTSRFDIPEFDESSYVNDLALKYQNINTHFCQLTEEDFKTEFDAVLRHQDEPFGSLSLLAQWEVMKLAKKNGIKVLLDGQGGDEQLAGYRKYFGFYLKELLAQRKLWTAFGLFSRLIFNKQLKFFELYQIKRYIGGNAKLDIYSERGLHLPNKNDISFSASNTVKERSYLDITKFSFPPLLRYEDRNSMAHSIETRVPFMDYRLVEFLYSLPAKYKIKGSFTKAILRDSLTGILPDSIRLRKSKLGFSTPQDVWMKTTLNDYFKSYFKNMQNPYFNNQQVFSLFNRWAKNKMSSDLFFRIYCFDKWYNDHFKN